MIMGTCQSTADGRYCECIAPEHKFDAGFDCVGKYNGPMLTLCDFFFFFFFLFKKMTYIHRFGFRMFAILPAQTGIF